jgi:hypothetical protein
MALRPAWFIHGEVGVQYVDHDEGEEGGLARRKSSYL